MKKVTISFNLYPFSELTKKAQQVALNKLRDINLDENWWDFIYEDANNIGLKLTGFDLDRSKSANGEFVDTAITVANKITKEHGKSCDTYKLAKTFIKELKAIAKKYINKGEDNWDEQSENETAQETFLKDLLAEYADMLQKEYEYRYTDEAVKETIEANDYLFFANGSMAHTVEYRGEHPKSGIQELKIENETFEI